MQTPIERLVSAGVHELAGMSADDLRALSPSGAAPHGAVLAVHPHPVGATRLTARMRRDGKPGFVVVDMTDLDDFAPIDGLDFPDAALYWVHDVDRGDDLANWSPDEALPAIQRMGRSPLTISEGISWVLQQPAVLEPGRCFMCIGSRRTKPAGEPDARTPALWISTGTGRDGPNRAGAPKTGWCWAGNRHTWLGVASTAGRL